MVLISTSRVISSMLKNRSLRTRRRDPVTVAMNLSICSLLTVSLLNVRDSIWSFHSREMVEYGASLDCGRWATTLSSSSTGSLFMVAEGDVRVKEEKSSVERWIAFIASRDSASKGRVHMHICSPGVIDPTSFM